MLRYRAALLAIIGLTCRGGERSPDARTPESQDSTPGPPAAVAVADTVVDQRDTIGAAKVYVDTVTPKAAPVDSGLIYEHRFLGPFVLGPGAEFRIDLRVARLASARGGSDVVAVDSLRIVDGTDAVHFARDYKVILGGDSGFDDWIEITASMLETSQGPVLVVDESMNPSAPGTGESRQFFGLVDGRLRPLTSRVSGYGNFAGLPAGQQPGSSRLLAGDRMEFRAWEGHFGIALPLELRFPGRPGASAEGLALVLETDSTWGLTILPVGETADIGPRYRAEVEQVTLFRSPTGPGADTVIVRKGSRIEYGPAYGRAWLNLDARRDELGIGVDIARLRVVIDGKAGFIEEDDYEKVGLSQAS